MNRWVYLPCLLVAGCVYPCPDAGFTAPGDYTAFLDSHSTMAGPSCQGVDSLATGVTIDIHFESDNALALQCTTWIQSAGGLTSPSYPQPTGVLSYSLGKGVFVTTLASGCSGRWEVSIANLDRSAPAGTTPATGARPYFLTRVFIPDNTAECRSQFGSFSGYGQEAVCTDAWAIHLSPVGI